jgi:hypothetical protein
MKSQNILPDEKPLAIDYQTPNPVHRRRIFLYVAGAIGVLVAVVAHGPIVSIFRGVDKPPQRPEVKLPTVPSSTAAVRTLATQRIEPHLDWADHESQRVVADHIKAVDDFFTDAKKGTPGFAKEVLGWSSKWRLVVDKLPYTRTDRHALFLKRTFNERIFPPERLTTVLHQVVKNYVASLNGIENQMLVKMRLDVKDLPPDALPAFGDEAKLRVAFERAMAEATERVRADLKADISREATSLVVGEVLTMVAVRLGVSTGILVAGTSSSWATFGIGFVVAVIVDQIVSWVWDWWRDPVGDLTTKMNNKLDEIHRLIVDGDSQAPGLRARLEELSKKRAALRRAAVMELLQPTEGGKR